MLSSCKVKVESLELFFPLVSTFLVKAIVSLGAIFLLVVVGRHLGSHGLGVFSLLQSLSLVLATVSRFGMSGSLIKYIAENEIEERGRYLFVAIKISLFLALILSLFFGFSKNILMSAYGYIGIRELLPGMVLTLIPITVSGVLSGYFKGVKEPLTASLLENGAISIVAICLIEVVVWQKSHITLSSLGWIYAISAWLVMGWGVFRLKTHRLSGGASNKLIKEKEKPFLKASASFLVIHIAVLVNSLLGIIVAGIFLNAAELGQLRVAGQLAALITFVLIVIDVVFPPRYAYMYQKSDLKGLESLARKSVYIGVAVSAPIFLAILIAPSFFLGLFGQGFVGAEIVLIVLAVGQFFNVSTGSVGFLLNMTGHVHVVRNITLISSAVGVLLILIMTPAFGLLGAATGLSLAVIIQNSAALYYVKKKLNVLLWAI